MKLFVVVLVCILLMINILGCAGLRESGAFKEACAQNTVSAYNHFLNKFPQTKYKAETKDRMGALIWKTTEAENTIKSYRAFLHDYPNHKFVSEATSKLIQLRWDETCRNNNEDAYWSFAKEFPKNNLAAESMAKAGDLAWARVQDSKNISALEEFVNRYPSHPKAKEAGERLAAWRIDEAKKAFATLPDIELIIWDEANSWPIFAAAESDRDSSLPPMDLDDLVVAFKVIQSGDNPGVSIEPPGMDAGGPGPAMCFEEPPYQQVRYIPGWTKGTHFGQRLFEADKMLKALGFGKDPSTHKRVGCSVPGFQTLPRRASRIRNMEAGYFGRIWFKPKEVILQESGNAVKFAKVSMGVESESPYSAPTAFAKHFEKNYNAMAQDKPIYRELLRMAKITGAARWLNDRGHQLNVDNYKCRHVNCPSKTSTIKGLVSESQSGIMVSQLYLMGGVSFETENSYSSGGNIHFDGVSIDDVSSRILKARPYKMSVSWEFDLGDKKYRAVAIPL